MNNEADAIIILNIMHVRLVKVQEETLERTTNMFFPSLFFSSYMQFTFRAAGIPDSI